MDEGLRLHLALCTVAERLAGVMEGARFERRDGYVLMTFPTLPIPSFNGVWADEDSAAVVLGDALAEVEAEGIAAGVLTRRGETPAVEEAARELGLTGAVRIPGMVANAGDLDKPTTSELEVISVATPSEHRGRGYGAAITWHAVREGFATGAELAYLQASAIGESVYRRLGFREVVTYLLLTRPAELTAIS